MCVCVCVRVQLSVMNVSICQVVYIIVNSYLLCIYLNDDLILCKETSTVMGICLNYDLILFKE